MSVMSNLYVELVECMQAGLSDESIARVTGLPLESIATLTEQIERNQMREELATGYNNYYGA